MKVYEKISDIFKNKSKPNSYKESTARWEMAQEEMAQDSSGLIKLVLDE